MKNKNFGRKRQAIYILSNRKSTRIIKTLMDFFFFIKVKIKMVCFSVPSYACGWALSSDDMSCTMQMLLDDADDYMYKNKQLCKKYKGNRKYE